MPLCPPPCPPFDEHLGRCGVREVCEACGVCCTCYIPTHPWCLLCSRGQSNFGERADGWRRVKNRRPFHAVKVRSIRFSADGRPLSLRNRFTAPVLAPPFAGAKGGETLRRLRPADRCGGFVTPFCSFRFFCVPNYRAPKCLVKKLLGALPIYSDRGGTSKSGRGIRGRAIPTTLPGWGSGTATPEAPADRGSR